MKLTNQSKRRPLATTTVALMAAVVLMGALTPANPNPPAPSSPLERVKIEGTQVTTEVVLEIARLHLGQPVNRTVIEEGCKRLQASGLFQSIVFRYAQGPKFGYVLTLTLTDFPSLSEASIDIPGIDENEIWRWLMSRYPHCQHKVPGTGAAQQFMTREIEEHFGANLEGQHLAARLESDLVRQKLIVSFQLETLPKISMMNFTGQREFSAIELGRIMERVVGNDGYTDRRFRAYLELNIRGAYEERGMYRVRFPSVVAQKTGTTTVAVTAVIEEGPKYTLGDVQLIGENLPTGAMLKTANFKTGGIANWTEIQQAIWETERHLRRIGYMAAAATSERVFHDDQRIVDVKVSFRKSGGPSLNH